MKKRFVTSCMFICILGAILGCGSSEAVASGKAGAKSALSLKEFSLENPPVLDGKWHFNGRPEEGQYLEFTGMDVRRFHSIFPGRPPMSAGFDKLVFKVYNIDMGDGNVMNDVFVITSFLGKNKNFESLSKKFYPKFGGKVLYEDADAELKCYVKEGADSKTTKMAQAGYAIMNTEWETTEPVDGDEETAVNVRFYPYGFVVSKYKNLTEQRKVLASGKWEFSDDDEIKLTFFDGSTQTFDFDDLKKESGIKLNSLPYKLSADMGSAFMELFN